MMGQPAVIDGDEQEYRERFAAVFDSVMGDAVSPEVRDAVREKMADIALKCYKLPTVNLTAESLVS